MPQSDDSFCPTVSILVAAYNEEAVLHRCLTALVNLDFPKENLEFLVGSDGSSDGTNAILRGFASTHPQVSGIEFTDRRGKIPVMNDLARRAKGDILLFTDADVAFAPDACKKLVRHFADPEVGGVTGLITLTGVQEDGPLAAEKEYLSYEVRLRNNESNVGSTVGIHGGDYALRRKLWSPLPDEPICDELYAALLIISKGLRMVFEPQARATEKFSRTMRDEYNRRKRFATRGLFTLRAFPLLLEPTAGVIAVMLWSHKILRWLAPFFLLAFCFGTLLSLFESRSYSTIAVIVSELAIGLLVLVGYLSERFGVKVPLCRSLYWLFVMNVSFAVGTLTFLFNKERSFWPQPTRSREGDSFSRASEVNPGAIAA